MGWPFFVTLYFQILTQTQEASALNLLRFPTLLRTAGEHQGSATLASGGFVQKFKFANVEDLLSKACSRPFNELELKFTISTADLGSCRFNRVAVTGVFKPSACSELWLSHSKWERGLTREWLSRKMNAKAKEGALAYNKVDRAPCCYELVLSVPRKQTRFELLRGIANCIAQRMPSEMQDVDPFGCCDVGQFLVKFEGEAIYNAKVKVLHNIYPSHYPKLGDYFDDLHPVVFGDPELCSQIARAIGSGVQLVSGDKAHRIACLVRTPDCNIDVARAKASRWLLMKNGKPIGPPD